MTIDELIQKYEEEIEIFEKINKLKLKKLEDGVFSSHEWYCSNTNDAFYSGIECGSHYGKIDTLNLLKSLKINYNL